MTLTVTERALRAATVPSVLARLCASLLVLTTLAACGSDDSASTPTTVPATTVPPATDASPATDAPTTAAPATDAPTTDTPTTDTPTTDTPTTAAPLTEAPQPSMRGERYCEILLVGPVDDRVVARVFNTYPLNDCPADQWAQIDPAAIATEQGAVVALANGPRYWLMDRIQKRDVSDLPRATFAGLEMIQQATVDITSLGTSVSPYTVAEVDRAAVFTFDAGSTVFQLTDDTGRRFVMQSYSQQVDPALDQEDLVALADRLTLPAGWGYAVVTLTESLTVDSTDSPAVVLQDDFRNTYSLVETD